MPLVLFSTELICRLIINAKPINVNVCSVLCHTLMRSYLTEETYIQMEKERVTVLCMSLGGFTLSD